MRLRLLHGELVTELRRAFGGIASQDLVYHLSEFELRPYSLATLASAINARTNEIVGEQPNWETAYRLEGLRSLYSLYSQSLRSSEHDIPRRPADLRVRILNRVENFVSADILYFGAEYPGGELTEYLYAPHFPEKMVAAPASLKLEEDADTIRGFLSWLGVASEPRLERLQFLRDEDFKRYVYDHLSYPATFGDKVVHSADELSADSRIYVSWIDGLDVIINKADPHAIVAWLALDERLERWRGSGDSEASLQFRPSPAHHYRTMGGQTLPSYVVWLLQRREWLSVSDGSRRAPITCTLATNLPEDVHTILPRPALNESDERFKVLRIDRKAIRFALERVGVNASLDDLSWDDFYALLLRLPESDPEGEHARAVYRALIAREDNNEMPAGSVREKFLREGKLWARQRGAAGYHLVRDGVYYADDATVPEIITREMRMLDLDRRRGALKVQRLFGARPLSYRDIEVEITNVDEHPHGEDLNDEVERLKAYVYAMRLYSDDRALGLRRLRALKVRLCQGATGSVMIDDEVHPISVSEGDMILDGDVAYLCSNTEDAYLLANPLIAHDVGEILARLLGVENGGDFAALAQCPAHSRFALLQRMLGIDPQPLLDEARKKLDPRLALDVEKEPLLPPPDTEPPDEGAQEGTTDPHTEETGDSTERNGPVGKVDVEQTQHTPLPPRKEIKGRVSATPSTTPRRTPSGTPANAKRAQQLAYRFEEADGQDRYPLEVDHLQGSGYFGCDLLSFVTREDRDRFKETRDESLVARFIEVKGRSSEKGSISLGGNELASASKHGNRFYLYRVFESEDGKFEVAILNNPTADRPRIVYEIDLFRSVRTTTYDVKTIE